MHQMEYVREPTTMGSRTLHHKHLPGHKTLDEILPLHLFLACKKQVECHYSEENILSKSEAAVMLSPQEEHMSLTTKK